MFLLGFGWNVAIFFLISAAWFIFYCWNYSAYSFHWFGWNDSRRGESFFLLSLFFAVNVIFFTGFLWTALNILRWSVAMKIGC